MNRRAMLASGSALALIAVPRPAGALCQLPATPQDRIEAALAEIKAALAELYPAHCVTGHVSLRVSTGLVTVGACPEEGYEARGHFHLCEQ